MNKEDIKNLVKEEIKTSTIALNEAFSRINFKGDKDNVLSMLKSSGFMASVVSIPNHDIHQLVVEPRDVTKILSLLKKNKIEITARSK